MNPPAFPGALSALDLLGPLDLAFFRNALIVATLAGALCGLVGVFVVLKGMSAIGHGLSHAIFGGFVASTLLGVNVLLGAGAWGVASALMVGGVTRRRIIGSDAAIGVITTASFALGLALIAAFGRTARNFEAVLFGSVLGVSSVDVAVVVAVAVLAVTVVVVNYRSLLFLTFDPEVAEVSGVPGARLEALLMLVLAASILVTMQVLGVTLVAATLVIPATVARMMTSSFSRMLLLAALIGAGSGFVGIVVSYHLDVQSGPAIVLVGAALFTVVFLTTGRRGRMSVGHLVVAQGAPPIDLREVRVPGRARGEGRARGDESPGRVR
ncbi:MAG: metal ABC transporter permease [Acidimicrobiales bacterium]